MNQWNLNYHCCKKKECQMSAGRIQNAAGVRIFCMAFSLPFLFIMLIQLIVGLAVSA